MHAVPRAQVSYRAIWQSLYSTSMSLHDSAPEASLDPRKLNLPSRQEMLEVLTFRGGQFEEWTAIFLEPS